jgi:RNA polymerase sigma-70 factor (ECF subfamily)
MLTSRPSGTGTLNTDPDHDIRMLVAAGELETALRLLMQRHGADLHRYCREALRDGALADDVHQQTFIAAFHDLRSFEGRSKLRTWLFAIARFRVLDAAKMRRRARARIEELKLGEIEETIPAAGELLDVRIRNALSVGLGLLEPHVRAAVLLHYQQGFTFEDIAEMSDEKPGTVHARVARGLRVLRAYLETGGQAGTRDRRRSTPSEARPSP